MPSSSDTLELLTVSGISKNFGPVQALKNIDLRVQAGSVHALMGGNGSGKSTLSKALLGVVRPDAGRIEVAGGHHVVDPASSRAAGIYGTYQETALSGDLTVAENILINTLPSRLGLASTRNPDATLTAVIDRVGLPAAVLDTKVRELPLDQRCLAELARVLVHRPRLLIIDELTASLRRDQVGRVGTILREVADTGAAVLFVSHRLEEVDEFCSSATVLRNGRTVLHTDDLSDHHLDDLMAAMTGGDIQAGSAARRRKARSESAGSEESTTTSVLEVADLEVAEFGSRISLHGNSGEIVGVSGLSGNGQSELLRSLYGAVTSREGDIRIDGVPVRIRSVADAVRGGIGYISGEREREMVFGHRSIEENLGVVAMAFKKLIDPSLVMHRMALVTHRRAQIRSLSGGNQQKVVVGRWLGIKPRVLLADDPTRGVDVQTRNEIHGMLREMVTSNSSAAVVVSSDDHELAEICDRVYILHQGKVIEELAGDEVTEEAIAHACLIGHATDDDLSSVPTGGTQ
ncbi:sugar ABC transporter ATP-binding protein [Mycolicibacterium palauense]|uniref:sugar ABC transporter ATP-binding protein n=1 Tax=Mycolicibacterium palauense TaxID=2034511 RepID=UPI000BFEEF0B|nr:sugar ABC transporter ATP-binding protein [Mycolicibacterium palauense]